jgi:hypothetical protein
VFWNAGGIVFYSDLLDNVEDLLALTSLQLVRSGAAQLLLRRAALTITSAIPRIRGLLAFGNGARNSQFELQEGIAGTLAAEGGI